MTTVVRDPWADATMVATRQVLDPEVARARRRVWVRRALGVVLPCVVLLAVAVVVELRPDTLDTVRDVPPAVVHAAFALAGFGIVLMLVAVVRSPWAGIDGRFVGPDALLTRADRVWLREQIANARAVPAERRAVVADAARRMVAEGRHALLYVGLACLYVGLLAASPNLPNLLVFASLTAWMLVAVVRARRWSRRARRWLALDA